MQERSNFLDPPFGNTGRITNGSMLDCRRASIGRQWSANWMLMGRQESRAKFALVSLRHRWLPIRNSQSPAALAAADRALRTAFWPAVGAFGRAWQHPKFDGNTTNPGVRNWSNGLRSPSNFALLAGSGHRRCGAHHHLVEIATVHL